MQSDENFKSCTEDSYKVIHSVVYKRKFAHVSCGVVIDLILSVSIHVTPEKK